MGGLIINGRPLELPLPATAQRVATVHFRRGAKKAKSLRELTGVVTVTAECETGPAATILSPLTAGKKTVEGRDGWGLALHSITKKDDGSVEATVTVMRLAANPLNAMGPGVRFGGRVVINGVEIGGDSHLTPVYPRLTDEKGRLYKLEKVGEGKAAARKFADDRSRRTFTLTYKPPATGSKPDRLALWALETAQLDVSFTLSNVTLP
jgi:hypothetical protein